MRQWKQQVPQGSIKQGIQAYNICDLCYNAGACAMIAQRCVNMLSDIVNKQNLKSRHAAKETSWQRKLSSMQQPAAERQRCTWNMALKAGDCAAKITLWAHILVSPALSTMSLRCALSYNVSIPLLKACRIRLV